MTEPSVPGARRPAGPSLLRGLLACLLLGPPLLFAPPAAAEPGSAVAIARVKYGGGGDWYNDPEILPNLLRRYAERFGAAVDAADRAHAPTDPDLFRYPILFLTGHGNIAFTEADARALREHLLAGGFLYADDDYGMDASFRREIAKVFPDLPLQELPPDHPIYRVPNRLPKGLPKIHDHDPGPPRAYGIFRDGRMLVLYTFNSNISDGWADERTHQDAPEIREQALDAGVNILFHALTN